MALTEIGAPSSNTRAKVRRLVRQRPGYFPHSLPPSLHHEHFVFVHLDADLYELISEGPKFFYRRAARRGKPVIHDYNSWSGSRRALGEFFSDKDELPLPMPEKSSSAVVTKH